MGSKGKNESVSGVIEEYIRNADKESRDFTFNVDEIFKLFAPTFKNNWTDEENYEFRLKGCIRQVLNKLDFYSLGGGEYYDVVNGTDEIKKAAAMTNHRKQAYAQIRAINRLMKELEGQLYMFINEKGELEIREYGT